MGAKHPRILGDLRNATVSFRNDHLFFQSMVCLLMTTCNPINKLRFNACEQLDLKWVHPQLVKDVERIIEPITSTLPSRRSGYTHGVFAVFQCLILLFQLSAKHVAQWMNDVCRDKGISFQESKKKLNFPMESREGLFPTSRHYPAI